MLGLWLAIFEAQFDPYVKPTAVEETKQKPKPWEKQKKKPKHLKAKPKAKQPQKPVKPVKGPEAKVEELGSTQKPPEAAEVRHLPSLGV